MTGCHAEECSRAAQGSGIWELWTVISPKFSTHSMSTTTASYTKYTSSSPDAEQSRPPTLHWGRLPNAWVLALLVTSLLALNKLHILCINELLSEPAVLYSQILTRVRAPPPPGNNIHDTFPIGTRHLIVMFGVGYFDLSNMDLPNKSKYLPIPEDRSRASSQSAMPYYKIRQWTQSKIEDYVIVSYTFITSQQNYCSVVL